MSGLPPIISLLTADAPGLFTVFPPQWGIFGQDGTPVLVSDSVASVEYTREYSVSDYPQEQGAFESYNKVQIPYEAKVTLLSSLTRQELLNTLEPIVGQLLPLVTVVTPEISYQSANLLRYTYRRTSRNGVSLIEVDVWCKEVRVSASTQTAGTSYPVGQTNGGSNLTSGSFDASATQFQGEPGPPTPTAPNNGQPAAINTGSTNAASPTTSGLVTPVPPPSAPSPPGPPDYLAVPPPF